MFDTMNIARKIKQARIAKNMTQMNLADAMGVSYQAVSNWERGNSMPDISKLGDLCSTLEISVNELLGMEEKSTAAVVKAMEKEELTMEELAEVAPVLPPQNMREQVDARMKGMFGRLEEGLEKMSQRLEETFKDTSEWTVLQIENRPKKEKRLDLSRLADMAPFLDQEYLDELVEQADVDDLDGVEELAPFLSRQALDKLVLKCAERCDFDIIEELAPFLSRETLDRLAEQVAPESIEDVVDIAPFLSQKALDTLVRRCEDAEMFDALSDLAPFVSKEVLGEMVERYMEKGGDADLSDLFPFLGKETLRKLAKYMMNKQNLDALEDLMPFV